MNYLNRTIRVAILSTCLALPIISLADPATATRLVLEAKEALDGYYGSEAQLTLAAGLLTRAMAENKEDAATYVQAARLVAKGGHIVGKNFRPGTIDAFGELLDRALSLDPNNAKAHMLKAQYFRQKGAHTSERVELDKAKEIGTNDRWLLIDYARFYRSAGDLGNALRSYSEVRMRGPGESLDQRNAYIAALSGLATLAAVAGDEKTLRELIDPIRKDRDSRDAWALGNLAELLVRGGMFDEAIALSREALQTMNYGAGRLNLAAALFGKASELTLAGKTDLAEPLIKEARYYGYDSPSLLRCFEVRTPKMARLFPTIKALIE